jgi:hypothetical protein
VAVVRLRKGVIVVDQVAAVTDRLLVDVGADGRGSVSTWLDGELPSPAGEPVELVWPLDAEALGYRMIARPLLERLDAVRGRVDLVVLRPPTLEHLTEVLAAARDEGEPFQVVHFDGHGVLADRPASTGWDPLTFHDPAPQGVLVFERPGGGADRVPAAQVAGVLAAARVPVVALNACQSGAVGKQAEAAMTTRLLQEGAASVVAMAYSVYAVAAAEFMAAFYERLFARDRVADAVTAGRARLARRNTRPPTHGDGPLAAVGGFVGRDGLFYTIEVAVRLQHVVVLYGPGGTGKTELAKAFGRWWRDTGGWRGRSG